MPTFQELDQRWRLLMPLGTVVVTVAGRDKADREKAVQDVRALPAASRVALVGGRHLGKLAKLAGIEVSAEYIALPSLATPVAITQVAQQPLHWMTRTVLTVPSGVTRWHLPFWLGIRAVRVLPRLLSIAPAGDHILIGVRT